MLHCRVRSCWRVTRYKIDLRKLPVFIEVCRGDRSTSGCFMGYTTLKADIASLEVDLIPIVTCWKWVTSLEPLTNDLSHCVTDMQPSNHCILYHTVMQICWHATIINDCIPSRKRVNTHLYWLSYPGCRGQVLYQAFNPWTAGVSGWISDSYCSIKPLCSGMGEVVPARTSPTLLPPSPRTVL